MGLIYTVATIGAMNRATASIETKFLVDTGAIDCLVPTVLLREAGIEPEGTDLYELADGQIQELSIAWACLCFMDTTVFVKVVFAPDEAEPLLGVVALELAGVTVDPGSNTLRRLPVRYLRKASFPGSAACIDLQ